MCDLPCWKGKTLCNLNRAKGIGREKIPEKGAYFGFILELILA